MNERRGIERKSEELHLADGARGVHRLDAEDLRAVGGAVRFEIAGLDLDLEATVRIGEYEAIAAAGRVKADVRRIDWWVAVLVNGQVK